MDVKLATLIKSLNIVDVIFSGFTVQLVTVVKHSYVRKYRFQKILEPFMADMKRL